jgi:hypothetical protein
MPRTMRTRPTIPAACIAAAAMLWIGGIPSVSEAKLRTIRWEDGQVTRIGSFNTTSSRFRQPTLARAIAAFGRPSSRRRSTGNVCIVNWGKLGIRAQFANLGGIRPGQTVCTPSVGLLDRVTVRGRGFQTQKGLRVGDSTERLQTLHPGATYQDGTWWLATAPAVFGDVQPDERSGVVRAFTRNSHVTLFALSIGAAGE